MSILVIGGNGSIGTRYQAVLRYLDKPCVVSDIGHSVAQTFEMAKQADGVIIASPTDTHAEWIHTLSPLRKPILCEKPICKDMSELSRVFMRVSADRTPFKMVFQYSYLDQPSAKGWSHYNYFRTGKDGLVWDCIQIIGLARGRVELENDSPIWRCILNGRALELGAMDAAYVHMIRDWLKNPAHDLGQIRAIHEKTDMLARAQKMTEIL